VPIFCNDNTIGMSSLLSYCCCSCILWDVVLLEFCLLFLQSKYLEGSPYHSGQAFYRLALRPPAAPVRMIWRGTGILFLSLEFCLICLFFWGHLELACIRVSSPQEIELHGNKSGWSVTVCRSVLNRFVKTLERVRWKCRITPWFLRKYLSVSGHTVVVSTLQKE